MSTKSSVLTEFKKVLLPSEQESLKVLMVAPEVSPYANVGGVSRVISALSRSLVNLGHDARVFMPKFGSIDEDKYDLEMVLEGLEVPTGVDEGDNRRYLICNVKKHRVPGGPLVYFLENMEYYEKRANVYGYSDDSLRWALLSRGCLEFLCHHDWIPDIIHANDWQIGAVPNYLKTEYETEERFLPVATVYTIHNLNYQGMFNHKLVPETDLDDGRSQIASFYSKRLEKQNFARRGILYSDLVSTVSETYSREILTPECGEGLDRLLLEMRSKLFGVVNGVDYKEFNPKTDPLIEENFDVNSLSKRVLNKLALQKELGLPEDEEIPVLGVVGRLDEQKGLDLTVSILWPLLRSFDVQFIIVGGGDPHFVDEFQKLKKEFPEKVGAHLMPNFTLPRLVFAGSDIMLFPSKFEPCGIVQMEGMRYGAISVARATGGLADTVKDYDPKTNSGYGFVFPDYNMWQYFAQVIRALEVYRHPREWRGLVRRAMQEDFSWTASAEKYVDLYFKAIHFRKQDLLADGLVAPNSIE